MVFKRLNRLLLLKEKFSDNVFIFASGGSAKNFPLLDYKDSDFICVNGAVSVFIEKNITPFAYLFDDESFLINSFDLVLRAIEFSKYTFMPEELYIKHLANKAELQDSINKIYFIERVNRGYERKILSDKWFSFKNILNKDLVFNFSLFSNRKNRIGFSKNIENGYYCARTIPYVALQLAYYLGFQNVFMIGLDLNSQTGRFYERGSSLPTSIDQDYLNFILPSFVLLANHVIDEEFKVYNLSESSKLSGSVIKKITINELDKILNE